MRGEINEDHTQTLWENYQADASISNRNALIEAYYPIVSARVQDLGLVKGVDGDDLFQTGVLALIAAVDTFDPTRNVKFGFYAHVCIRRRLAWLIAGERKAPAPVEWTGELVAKTEKPQWSDERWSQITRGLRPREKQMLHKFYVQGMTYREIGQKRGVSRQAVAAALREIRNRIPINLLRKRPHHE